MQGVVLLAAYCNNIFTVKLIKNISTKNCTKDSWLHNHISVRQTDATDNMYLVNKRFTDNVTATKSSRTFCTDPFLFSSIGRNTRQPNLRLMASVRFSGYFVLKQLSFKGILSREDYVLSGQWNNTGTSGYRPSPDGRC